jgi:hypothetical protein
MQLDSLKEAIRIRLTEIDNYIDNVPDLRTLPWNNQSNKELVGKEYSRIIDLGTDLNRIILASEYLQSKISEAISSLSNNTNIEIQQKTILKNALDLLIVRTKPLYNEKTIYTKLEIFYQRLYRDL